MNQQLRYIKNGGFESFALSKKPAPAIPPVSLYQQWDNYLDSPILTSDYPYQVTAINGGNEYLFAIPEGGYFYIEYESITFGNGKGSVYKKIGNDWVLQYTRPDNYWSIFPFASLSNIECNISIYNDYYKSGVIYSKTTI